MATQRYVSTSFWDDEWIQTLDPSEKLLYLYLMTNPLTNIAGVYKITERRISFDTGFNLDTIRHIFAKFEKVGKAYRKDEYVVLPSWPKHQKWEKSAKVNEGIVRILQELEPEIIEFLIKIGYKYPIDTLSIPYTYPSNYSDLDFNSNSDLENKNPPTPLEGGDGDDSPTSKPKKSQKQYITLSEAGLLIDSDHRISYDLGVKLKLFAQNRREIKKPMTRLALEQTIDLLMTKLDTDQQRIDCIQLSIANGWQGVFPDRIRGNQFTANAKPRAAQRDKFASLEGYREL